MIKYGVNSWVWGSGSTDNILKSIKKAKEMGFDGVEIPVEYPDKIDKRRIRKALESWDIHCGSIAGVTSSGRDLISPNKTIRENTKKYIQLCIDLAAEFGSNIVGGPFYSTVGKLESKLTRDTEWKYAASGFKEVGDYAEEKGVYITIEPLNRFETYFLNLTSDCIRLVRDVDSTAVKVQLDTFHANIEEKSISNAIREAGDLLYHVQICENDRGTPGSGHIEWEAIAKALKDTKYDHWLTIETFPPGYKEMAVCIWRPLAANQDEIAVNGLKFLKQVMK